MEASWRVSQAHLTCIHLGLPYKCLLTRPMCGSVLCLVAAASYAVLPCHTLLTCTARAPTWQAHPFKTNVGGALLCFAL
jgi:hypothetical protein